MRWGFGELGGSTISTVLAAMADRPPSVVAMTLAWVVATAGCSAGPDPCFEQAYPDQPVGCSGARVRVLGRSEFTASRINSTVAQMVPSLALGADHAFWSDRNGRILRTPKDGGATQELRADNGCSIADLAIDEVGLYALENCRLTEDVPFPVQMRLFRMDPETGDTTDLAIMPYAQGVAVVVHDGVVYFGMGTPSRTFVRGIPRDGPLEGPEDAFTPYAILGAYGTQLPLATLGEDVLVVDRSTNEVLTLANEPGIDPTSRYVHDRGIRGLADVAGTLFLVDSVLQNSWYVHRGFRVTSASSLVYDESELDRLVGDSADVYVAGDVDVAPSLTTRLYSLGANAEAAGAPTAVTAGLRRVTDMALDASHVFVVDDEISHEVRLVSVSRVSR